MADELPAKFFDKAVDIHSHTVFDAPELIFTPYLPLVVGVELTSIYTFNEIEVDADTVIALVTAGFAVNVNVL